MCFCGCGAVKCAVWPSGGYRSGSILRVGRGHRRGCGRFLDTPPRTSPSTIAFLQRRYRGIGRALHRELYSCGQKRLGKLRRRKLATLVAVKDLGRAVLLDRPSNRPGTEARVQGVRQFLRKDIPAVPIDHRAKIGVPTLDRHVSDIRGPHLGGPINRKVAQEIGIDWMRHVGH